MWAKSVFEWLPDYSNQTTAAFCMGKGPSCAVPLPSARIKPAFGDSLAAPATREYQLWQAHAIADAIGTLASTAKNLSNDKLLTMSFEGYDITIAQRLLTNWPQLDGEHDRLYATFLAGLRSHTDGAVLQRCAQCTITLMAAASRAGCWSRLCLSMR